MGLNRIMDIPSSMNFFFYKTYVHSVNLISVYFPGEEYDAVTIPKTGTRCTISVHCYLHYFGGVTSSPDGGVSIYAAGAQMPSKIRGRTFPTKLSIRSISEMTSRRTCSTMSCCWM